MHEILLPVAVDFYYVGLLVYNIYTHITYLYTVPVLVCHVCMNVLA